MGKLVWSDGVRDKNDKLPYFSKICSLLCWSFKNISREWKKSTTFKVKMTFKAASRSEKSTKTLCIQTLVFKVCNREKVNWNSEAQTSDKTNKKNACITLTTKRIEHRKKSNMFIYWWLNSNTWILALNEWTSNIKPKMPSLYLLNYSSYRLEHHFVEHWTDSTVVICR